MLPETAPSSPSELEQLVNACFIERELLQDRVYLDAVHETIRALDNGKLRVVDRVDGKWIVNTWIKEAILLYFSSQQIAPIEVGPFHYQDKIPLKTNYAQLKVRVVPPATARYGSFMEPGVVLMPSYVNIGAYIGSNTMIDNWALVGSCAQIGSGVHISANVVIGGVLEPPQAAPVIVEDGAFIGAGASIVEGIVIEQEAVIGARVSLTASSKIVDVRGSKPEFLTGRVPARAVVIPGAIPRKFPAGEFMVSCALIIGTRNKATDMKVSLNEVLREYNIET